MVKATDKESIEELTSYIMNVEPLYNEYVRVRNKNKDYLKQQDNLSRIFFKRLVVNSAECYKAENGSRTGFSFKEAIRKQVAKELTEYAREELKLSQEE
jgi:hypothetical protein